MLCSFNFYDKKLLFFACKDITKQSWQPTKIKQSQIPLQHYYRKFWLKRKWHTAARPHVSHTFQSSLSHESDLKELMKSYQQSLMMWHRRQFVDERRRRRRIDGILQLHACLMNWQEENFLLNLSALKITCDIESTSTTLFEVSLWCGVVYRSSIRENWLLMNFCLEA